MQTETAEMPPPVKAPKKRRSRFWGLTLFVAAVAAVAAGVVYVAGVEASRNRLQAAYRQLTAEVEARTKTPEPPPAPDPYRNWDGFVHVTRDEQDAIGFRFAAVKAQTDPLKLELTGRTAYDPDTLTKIRPRFDTRVEKVFASLGETVEKGTPLVELYSTDLASAKNDFQTKYVQWQHDLKLLTLRRTLQASGAISQQLWVDTQNDEQKSRLDFSLAQDKLAIFYEVPKEEIEPLLSGLGEQAPAANQFGSVSNKARMTIRAKKKGIVIEREVVPGNYYESTDVLMTIAPLDHLWVWVNVYERDQDKVSKGQEMEIQFPFIEQKIVGKVDYVATQVSKDTRAVKVRASISNPEGRLKSDMLVKASLYIQPVKGNTVIPRLAMVAINGTEYAFVRMPRETDKGEEKTDRPEADRFRRIEIKVAQENTEDVIVSQGLKPGEEVITNGSLILSQLYEDQAMVVTGQPGK